MAGHALPAAGFENPGIGKAPHVIVGFAVISVFDAVGPGYNGSIPI